MKASHAVLFLISIAILIGIILVLAASGPRYEGRSLTSWLQQCAETPLMETQRLAEAQAAVRAIGARRALPKLVSLVESKEDPVSRWMIAKNHELRTRARRPEDFFAWKSAEDFQQFGIAGFEVLNTNAAPAVEELATLLDQADHSFTAMRCLSSIGRPAESVLCRALTNQDERVRKWSVDGLAAVTDDVAVYITRIKGRLKDPSAAVRETAVDDIGIQTSAPELAVPLLVVALRDSSDAVSAHAANSLANFGTNALEVFPILRNLVESNGSNTASAALKTLVIIAPDESFSILTNSIARGRPAVDDAVRTLADIAPEKALPIVLDRVKSPNPGRRLAAFALLCHYPMNSRIESAMQAVAAGSDIELARRAKEILTEKYEKEHPLESEFSGETSCEGKPLGEWLKMHDREGEYSEAAKQAIRRMGTNAIPSLLKRLVFVKPPFGLPAYEVNIDAMKGFISLGEETKWALPQLQAIMDGTNSQIAIGAMMSSCGTGSNAIPVLIKGLTNQFPDVRNEAACCLSGEFGARFPDQRKLVAPLLVKLLHDPDEYVRRSVTNELKEIDPAAAAKAGIK
jgi:HEAT repeat protein